MRVVLASTFVLVAGCGDNAASPDGGIADASELTCTHTMPWARMPDVATGPIQETATVAVDGKIYVLGGFNASSGVVPRVSVFDPVACSWSEGPPLPRAVHHINAAVVANTIFVLGGLQEPGFAAVGTVWAWEVGSTAWTPRTAMPAGTERGSAVTAAIGGSIYVAGGYRGRAVADHSRYIVAEDRWEALRPLPAPRDHGCGGALAGSVWVVGGRNGAIEAIANTTFRFDPLADSWSTHAPMPTARGGTACAAVTDRLVVFGGEGNVNQTSGVFPNVEAYSPSMDRWVTLPDMPTPRHGMAAASVDDTIYVPGGATVQAFGAVSTNEALRPAF